MKTKSSLFRLDRLLLILFLLVACSVTQESMGQTPYLLSGWNPNGTNSTNLPSNWAASTLGSGVQSASLERGDGVTNTTGANSFAANSWNGPSSLGEALTADDYFEFTLAPITGNEMSLDRVEFRWRTTGTGPQNWQFVYSFDGFSSSTNSIGSATAITGGGTQTNNFGVDLSGISDLQGFTSEVTFRLVAWGASSAAGTASLFNNNTTTNALSIYGTSTLIPLPSEGLFWTANGSTLGGGGSTWNTTGSNWSPTDDPVVGGVWDGSSKAIFAGTAGTVTVDTVTASGGIQFSTTGYTLTGGTLTLDGVDIEANTITTDASVGATINSILAGTAGLTKAGNGTLTLGGVNTYTGGTVISAGSLVGTTTSLQGIITNNGTLVFNQNTNGTFSGVLTNGTGFLVKEGSGTVTLTERSEYSGGVFINGGAFSINGINRFGTIDATVHLNSGTLITTAFIDSGRAFVIQAGGGTIDTGANNMTIGAMTGTGAFTKLGSGTLTTGNFDNGTGTISVSAGTMVINPTFTRTLASGGTINGVLRLGSAQSYNFAGGTFGGTGSIQVAATGTSLRTTSGNSPVINPNIQLNSSDAAGPFRVNIGAVSATTVTLNGIISGNSDVRFATVDGGGTGTIRLNAANTYTGNTEINFGTTGVLRLGVANALPTTTGVTWGVSENSGSLDLNGNNQTLAYIATTENDTGGIANTGAAAVLSINQSINTTFGGRIGQTFDSMPSTLSGWNNNISVVKSGSGTLTLAGQSTYSGGTTVNEGALLVANNSALGSGAVTMNAGSTLATDGTTIANNFTIGTAGGFAPGDNVFVAGWDFQTTANGGTALVAAPDTPTTILANFGDQAGAAAIYLDGSFGSFAFATNQLSAVTGTALNATNTFVDPSVTMSTTTTGAAALSLINASGTVNDESIVLSLDMSGLQRLELSYASTRSSSGFTTQTWSYSTDAATWTSFATNSVGTSFAVFSADMLTGLDDAATGYLRLTLSGAASGGTGRLDNILINAQTIGEPISGSGTGTLGISEAGSAAFSGGVTVNNTATFAAAAGGQAIFSGVVSGTGTVLSKTGAGTVTLSGSSANTFTGTTTVSAGTLELAKTEDVTALAGAVTVNTGATLLLSSSGNVANTAAVTLSGGTIQRASGVSEVFGNLNVTAASFLDFGTGSAGTMEFSGIDYAPSALFTLQLFNFTQGNTFVIKNATDLSSFIGSGFTFDGDGGFGSSSFSDGTFTITAIPEPMMLWPARRRLLKDVKSVLGLRAPMRDRLARSRQ